LLKEAPLVPNFKIVVNGKALSRNLATGVNRLAVENEINVPAMITIRFNTGDYLEEYRQVGELESFKQGDRIGIFMGMDQTAAMMDGEVVALEWGFGDTPFLEVRGYDLLHRLRFGTRDRYFEKQKDSQILKVLAAEAGLNLKAEDSASIHPYISQINQSNFQFLKDLARRIGFEFGVYEDQLFFRKTAERQGPDLHLTYGVDLPRFTMRVQTPTSGSRVELRSTDPKTQKAITVVAQPGRFPSGGEDGAALVEAAFGSATLIVSDENPVDRREAERIAQARQDEIYDKVIAGEGQCPGNPELRAGKTVAIKGIGKKFDGVYRLISTSHVWDEQGYLTSFKVQKGSAVAVDEGEQKQQESQSRIYGVMTGRVTSNQDPEKLGRVRVEIPRLGSKFSANWARPAAFMAGKERGAFFLPEVGDEVLVAFEYGDVALPYIIGSLWNGEDRPPDDNADGRNDLRIIKSRSGHTIRFVDRPREERLEIADKSGKNRIDFKLTISAQNLELAARDQLI
jgi:phage protein D